MQTLYIQLNGVVDVTGSIRIMTVEKSNVYSSLPDSVVSFKFIENTIAKDRNAISVLNELGKLGWELITAIYFGKGEDSRPNSPFVAYYLRKSLQKVVTLY